MTFHHTALTASAIVLALAIGATAQAGTRSGGIPFGGGVTSNSLIANNTAAGTKNQASQMVIGNQFGQQPFHGFAPGVGTNSTVAGNVAAGEGNKAHQGVMSTQLGGGGFGPWGGGMPGSNSVTANNVAAGMGNFASQQIFATQR